MKSRLPGRQVTSRGIVIALCVLLIGTPRASALEGRINIHDPSTVIVCDGHYYVFGTGGGIPILSSPDGFTWQRQGKVFDQIPEDVRASSPKNNGTLVWAPDVIKLNDEYYVYYSVSSWGSFVSGVGLITSPTLDPASPKYKWTDRGLVVNSVEGQALNAIDPGVISAPDGTLWICYGSYHGNIELVQLDPKTGLRISPKSPVYIISNGSEASEIIFHDGYYYLFVNHGSCCQGKNSTYNIRVGRCAKITGPYLDRDGGDMVNRAGTLFLGASEKQIGPGHFGRLIDDGVEKFSCHYEADLDLGGRSVLDIRPLLWTADGWPMPGENLKDGTYRLGSKLAGKPLSKAVQKWSLARAGGGFYKITDAGGGKALEVVNAKPADDVAEAVDLAEFTGADNQVWKIDELTDGNYRIASKVNKLALTAGSNRNDSINISAQTFAGSESQRWAVASP